MVGELTWQKRLFGLWLPLAGFLVVALFPFTWMAATSLKTNAELYDPTAMPLAIRHPSLVHYIDLLKETNFLTWIANTMLVAVIATGISLLLGSMLAYPLARMRFRGGALLAVAVAITYLIPQTLLFVPMADLIGRLKLAVGLHAVDADVAILGVRDVDERSRERRRATGQPHQCRHGDPRGQSSEARHGRSSSCRISP